MGVESRRPLPAPTDPSTQSSIDNGNSTVDDLATDISRRTDYSSFSIPEDGSPVTISTKKYRAGKDHPSSRAENSSKTSLLIEYFEAGKSKNKVHSRPSVRVRVTPSHSKSKSLNDRVQISESRNRRNASYSQRISLASRAHREHLQVPDSTDLSNSTESHVASRPPFEVEVLQHASDFTRSDLSQDHYMPVASEVSSMPADSMLEGDMPRRNRSRSLGRSKNLVDKNTLKTPSRRRSRSVSHERIAQKVIEKLYAHGPEQIHTKHRKTRSRNNSICRDDTKPIKRHSNHSAQEDERSYISTSSAGHKSVDLQSPKSGVSMTSSINNPKLLQTVEDVIRRLIIPDINALKEHQKVAENRLKFESTNRNSNYEGSRSGPKIQVSKSSSAPNVTNPKLVLNRDGEESSVTLSINSVNGWKSRGLNGDNVSEKAETHEHSYDNDNSVDNDVLAEDFKWKKKTKENCGIRNTMAGGASVSVGLPLTTSALHNRDSYSSTQSRREKGSKITNLDSQVSDAPENMYRKKIPPLPMLSEIQDSELTRDSLISERSECQISESLKGRNTPVREVSRGSPRQVELRLPSTPIKGLAVSTRRSYRNPTTATSNDDFDSREDFEERYSENKYAVQSPSNVVSPVQSIASFHEVDRSNPGITDRCTKNMISMSSAGQRTRNLSNSSMKSSASNSLAKSRRPGDSGLERGDDDLYNPEASDNEMDCYNVDTNPWDVAEFYEKNNIEDDQYHNNSQTDMRSTHEKHLDYDSTGASEHLQDNRVAREISGMKTTSEYVHTPVAVESAVASLLGPSALSVKSSESGHLKGITIPYQGGRETFDKPEVSPEGNTTTDGTQGKWNSADNDAKAVPDNYAIGEVHRKESLGSQQEEKLIMSYNANPALWDPMPEIGFVPEDESEVTTNPTPIQGPGHRQSEWSYEPPQHLSRQLSIENNDPDTFGSTSSGAVAFGGTSSTSQAHMRGELLDSRNANADNTHDMQPIVENNSTDAQDTYHVGHGKKVTKDPISSPGMRWRDKDEGYMSAARGAFSPEPLCNNSRCLDGDGYSDGGGFEDTFKSSKNHVRHLSGTSHGMSSPLYDSAMGRGIDRIQSKDIIALMDHLTVRDAQRNARDTEILVSLVRSAAEMRNQFEDMKRYISDQDQMIMKNTDKNSDKTVKKILQGPRPQPPSSPRVPRQQASTEDIEDIPTRKKNVFKRALKGLSMRSSNDLAKIEDMLMQLLGDVEELKGTHGLPRSSDQTNSNSESLASYNNSKDDTEYEPEAHAGPPVIPNDPVSFAHSYSRRTNGRHSGYDGRQGSDNRISTVIEGDEDLANNDSNVMNDTFENSERLLTPTQEARRGDLFSQETPPQHPASYTEEGHSQENTPKRKHKSNSSSVFGIPKISRWSKTTASTEPRSTGQAQRHRPSSSASRSGSNLNINYDNYELSEDDRLRSTTSLQTDQNLQQNFQRPPSPLIPGEDANDDDPKYQAHRDSMNLQHPQPRPGPTHRHQTHLENQAYHFSTPLSPDPDPDQWGSNPSLALNRNRLSGGSGGVGAINLSPAASENSLGSRTPKEDDSVPLIPQQQQKPLYSSSMSRTGYLNPLAPIEEVRYSLEADSGRRVSG